MATLTELTALTILTILTALTAAAAPATAATAPPATFTIRKRLAIRPEANGTRLALLPHGPGIARLITIRLGTFTRITLGRGARIGPAPGAAILTTGSAGALRLRSIRANLSARRALTAAATPAAATTAAPTTLTRLRSIATFGG